MLAFPPVGHTVTIGICVTERVLYQERRGGCSITVARNGRARSGGRIVTYYDRQGIALRPTGAGHNLLHDRGNVRRALLQSGLPSRNLYGVDDLDPMDSQALLTPDAVERYMGVPLAHVPAPEGSAAESYARYFVGELFMGTFEGLGVHPEIYWMSELYGDGSMDRFIRTALDRAEVVRDIYLRVSNVERPPGWLPVSVICEVCGAIALQSA